MIGGRKAILGLTASLLALGVSAAWAQDAGIKVGLIGGITGPIESLMPPIANAAKLAVAQVNEASGIGKSGAKVEMVIGDDGCVDAARASDAADRQVNSEKVAGIVGAMCSGATIAAANAAAIPGGVVMVSPASTSPAVTDLNDNDLVFRTAPSDAYQGEVLARVVKKNGIDNVAITYVNNDYGTGFAQAFQKAFEADGGTVTVSQAHEDGKADYRAEIGSLASSGADALVVLAYVDGSGGRIVAQARETGDFSTFVGGDGMVGGNLTNVTGGDEKLILTRPGGTAALGAEQFATAAKAANIDPAATYTSTSYDAAFALLLALEKTGGSREGLSQALRDVASAPGEVILPGEWTKAKQLIEAGTDINYEGASGALEFDAKGDVPGSYDEVTVKDGKIVVVGPAM
ncbi:ABC transporter substrate-binding protein [Aureimonas phyllosphaerae]|uniref:Branched-chain amino acid transport system substrate-binding protein n=1 Tax=Aureimonas phyllosphaerae TaxID=1166078 RepID=A0A7W6FUQ3_9HYPH|nr:ABC transporter substrate-binding protein [Aureimonas phyllosphaerae]MBB3935267.1 branched-chain amino acid transport system substrate-binding protein [Aureimonas phyllosphaerae]MBB3959275.1 branched-chain amino acid transport system substrate-binding protein [Aureimonas phyllosphaerae]SFF05434.1 branched-chain amino acid transport system substrate-binding protein [Aureimonas phyllosphaerae]